MHTYIYKYISYTDACMGTCSASSYVSLNDSLDEYFSSRHCQCEAQSKTTKLCGVRVVLSVVSNV